MHKDYLYGSPYRNAVKTTCDVWSRLLRGRCGIIDGSLDVRRKRASYSAKPTLAMITAVSDFRVGLKLLQRVTSLSEVGAPSALCRRIPKTEWEGERRKLIPSCTFREAIDINNDTTSTTERHKRPGFSCFPSFSASSSTWFFITGYHQPRRSIPCRYRCL